MPRKVYFYPRKYRVGDRLRLKTTGETFLIVRSYPKHVSIFFQHKDLCNVFIHKRKDVDIKFELIYNCDEI